MRVADIVAGILGRSDNREGVIPLGAELPRMFAFQGRKFFPLASQRGNPRPRMPLVVVLVVKTLFQTLSLPNMLIQRLPYTTIHYQNVKWNPDFS